MDANEIRAVLAEIDSPKAGVDIVEAGLVGEIHIEESTVTITLTFGDVPRDVRHAIEDAVADRLEALDGVEDVTVDVKIAGGAVGGGGDGVTVYDPSQPSSGAPGPAAEAPKTPLSGVRNVIAVASGKGGVGKSTVAANLAIALSQRGARVGLLDLDIYGPSIPMQLGVVDATPGVTPDQKKFLPVDAYGLKVMSIGFMVDDDQPVIWRGPIVGSVVKQFIEDVVWTALDYLIIDMPPGTGDAQLTLSQTAPLTGAIIVTTPSELALVDAVKGMQMFRKVGTPVLGLVENMSHYACPSCGEHSSPFNTGGVAPMIEKHDIKCLGRIPIDIDIQRGGDQGKPVTAVMPDSPQARAFLEIADAVIAAHPFGEAAEGETRKDKKGGFLSQLFRR